MSRDIFDFWAACPDDAHVHPADAEAFARPFIGNLDTFDRRCLPACFAGRLRTAPVVLLYLSPGWGQSDVDEADTTKAQARYGERRKGYQSLDGANEHAGHYRWWTQKTAVFGEPEVVRDKIAFLNLCGYHSRSFRRMSPLRSCRPAGLRSIGLMTFCFLRPWRGRRSSCV